MSRTCPNAALSSVISVAFAGVVLAAIVSTTGSLGELGIDANGELTLCYCQMLVNAKCKTGLKLEPGVWSKVKLVCTGDELRLSANGVEAKKPLKVKLPGEGVASVSVGGYDRSAWNYGFFKGRVRNLMISQRAE